VGEDGLVLGGEGAKRGKSLGGRLRSFFSVATGVEKRDGRSKKGGA